MSEDEVYEQLMRMIGNASDPEIGRILTQAVRQIGGYRALRIQTLLLKPVLRRSAMTSAIPDAREAKEDKVYFSDAGKKKATQSPKDPQDSRRDKPPLL